MITNIIRLNTEALSAGHLDLAANVIRSGGLVAFPTETVYGLGANALDPKASKKIYEAKGRPSDNPLIVHIAKTADMELLARDIPKAAYELSRVFWPGPLTMILKKQEHVPKETTGGLETVAIRFPANRIARELIERSGVFVAAPSANISGKPSPTKAEHVINDMNGRIDMILDGGKATLGLESTIVDLSGEVPIILRPGCITREMLVNVIGSIDYDPTILSGIPNQNMIPKAPGMKYRHYAPEGNLTIYEGKANAVINEINKKSKEKYDSGYRVGIIATEETIAFYHYGIVKSVGRRKDETSIAAGLYDILRQFDKLHTEYIYTESFANNLFGQAIMNRLLKAAGYQLMKVTSGTEGH
jgi:L-threonylcarbamoyladenylate synthase